MYQTMKRTGQPKVYVHVFDRGRPRGILYSLRDSRRA